MGWPADDLSTNLLDGSTDSAAGAREQIYAIAQKVQAMLGEFPAGSTPFHSDNDGVGSGVDAGLLAGQLPAHYQNATNLTAGLLALARLPATLTGKNADSVDGIHASATATANKLLALNGEGKLPASITGDAFTLGGLAKAAFALVDHNHNSTNYTKTESDALFAPIDEGVEVWGSFDANSSSPIISRATHNVSSYTWVSYGVTDVNLSITTSSTNYTVVTQPGAPLSTHPQVYTDPAFFTTTSFRIHHHNPMDYVGFMLLGA